MAKAGRRIRGTNGDDVICGGGGNDNITGANGSDEPPARATTAWTACVAASAAKPLLGPRRFAPAGADLALKWVYPEPYVVEAEIKVRESGPYKVTGPIRLIDVDGNEYDVGAPGEAVVLCRCGGSRTKPFCDGTHKRIGFEATERASDG